MMMMPKSMPAEASCATLPDWPMMTMTTPAESSTNSNRCLGFIWDCNWGFVKRLRRGSRARPVHRTRDGARHAIRRGGTDAAHVDRAPLSFLECHGAARQRKHRVAVEQG